MPGPGDDLLFAEVGQGEQLAVLADAPEQAVRLLLVGHFHDGVLVEEVVGDDGQVVAAVTVGLEAVAHVAQDSAHRLEVERPIAYYDGVHGGATAVSLQLRGDAGRGDDAGVAGAYAPLGGGRQGQDVPEGEQVLDAVHLPAGQAYGYAVGVQQWAGAPEVVVDAGLAHPDGLGVGVGPGEAEPVLVEHDSPRPATRITPGTLGPFGCSGGGSQLGYNVA